MRRQLSCCGTSFTAGVMFRNRNSALDWVPREGDHVEARALVTLYEARGDFQLTSELRAFDSIYDGATPDAVIELHARLVRTTDGKAVAAKTFRVSERAGGTDIGTVSEAFSRALAKLDGQVVGWTLQQGNQSTP